MSQTDPGRLTWLPNGAPTHYWNGQWRRSAFTDSAGNPVTPPHAITSDWDRMKQPLAADRANGKIYIYQRASSDDAGTFFVSTDGGTRFAGTSQTALPPIPASRVYSVKAMPGRGDSVWASLDDRGLWKSADAGKSFSRVDGVAQAYLFAFGKNPPGAAHPAVFLYGRLTDGRSGIFRSDDLGRSWTTISKITIGRAMTLQGDRNVYGRVYLGRGGMGLMTGEISSTG